jgi:hypothetical protein
MQTEREIEERSAMILVTTLAVTSGESLGDHFKVKHLSALIKLLRRQVEALSLSFPGVTEAFRKYVLVRVSPFCPPGDQEAMDRVLTDEDPAHMYWLALAPVDMIRVWCRRKLAGPPLAPMPVAMFRIEHPGPGDPESGD